MKKYIAEFIGTAALVLFGCGAVTLGNLGALLGGAEPLGALALLPVALSFGLAVTAMAYGIGPVSGCHINPAVTIGVFAAGRMPASDVPGYIIAQLLGGLTGAFILLTILSGRAKGYDLAVGGLGQNGWGEGYLGAYSLSAAVLTEFVATFLFLVVILGATSKAGATPAAGLAIGLTLCVIHIVFINVTGVSVNPARSLGPALLVGGKALAQVWMFLIVPVIAAACAGALFKARVLEV